MRTLNRLAALALLAAAAATTASAQAPIKIGFLGTFSGPIGPLGQDNYDGFMLAVEQRGGKLGSVPVQVLKEDDQFKPDVGLQIAQKFIEKELVPIIAGVIGSNVMMAVHRPITEKQVFLIGSNAGPSAIAGAQCSPYQFIVSWQNDGHAEAAGKFATDKGYRRMVLIAPNYQAGKDVLLGFKRGYKGEVLDEMAPGLSQPDFSAELAQIAAAKPDAVYAFFPGATAVNFIRQYQQAGLAKTIPLQTSAMLDATTLPALKDSALGMVGTHFWAPDTDNPTSRAFVEAFEKKYGRIPSMFAAEGYDAALLLDVAIGKVKGRVTDKPAFMAALKAGNPNSVRGVLEFGNNNFPIQDWHAFQVAKDAKGRVSLKTIATPLKHSQDPYHQLCAMK
ncbi:ABC transporter substrate-binding protein [Pelomonas sp. KK5]|uniref:ABC transporter substrate-binding protein n=1 Tax=Pelomonas sp. KK5 TaxID=1855730 RepID=UPI00097C76C9|nr:ABC transporter substrate-binding protein [Pelomonas sp. KK5]